MSTDSSSAQSKNIWENKELNLDKTIVCFVNKKFASELSLILTESIAKIEKDTGCSINVHGQKAEVIWFCIKNDLIEQRRVAFNLINKAVNYSLNEVNIPKVTKQESIANASSFRLSSVSPPLPSVLNEPLNDDSNKPTQELMSIQFNQSFANSRRENFNTNNNNNNISNIKKMPKSSMTRSTTEGFISSLTHSNRPSSFYSNFNNEFISNNNSAKLFNQKPVSLEKKFEKLKIENNPNKYKLKNRYTVDFLLQRADTAISKKQPANWKELSEIYPMVCFSGKVISYFDPHKYHEHWEKTKKINVELHCNETAKYFQNINKKTNGTVFNLNNTDDFLNFNSFQKDQNNNFYSSFKQPRVNNMFHSNNNNNNTEQQHKHSFRRFEPLNYNTYNSAQQKIDTGHYYVKRQQQQIDMKQGNAFQHENNNSLRKHHPMSKTHSTFNFNP